SGFCRVLEQPGFDAVERREAPEPQQRRLASGIHIDLDAHLDGGFALLVQGSVDRRYDLPPEELLEICNYLIVRKPPVLPGMIAIEMKEAEARCLDIRPDVPFEELPGDEASEQDDPLPQADVLRVPAPPLITVHHVAQALAGLEELDALRPALRL